MLKNPLKKKNIEIIAEIANAHQGNPDLAIEIANNAVRAGADAIKFQMYFAEEFLTNNHPRFLHFKNQAFTKKNWNKIFKKVKTLKTRIYCDIFGEKALNLAEKYDLDGYKIHSSDISNFKLLERLSKLNKKKIILSAGGSTLREIAKAISKLYKQKKELMLLYGFQNYPTKISDLNMNNIRCLNSFFGKYCKIGYMDHTSGDDKINYYLPLFAIKLGATVIEKHITYDRTKKGIDYHSSLNPDEFKKFVRLIRSKRNIKKNFNKRLKLSLGLNKYFLTKKEIDYRNQVKKTWVANKSIKKNSIINKNNLIMKRSNEKIMIPDHSTLLGLRSLRSIKKDECIKMSDLKINVTALIIARMKSIRLPKKILTNFQGYNSLEHIILRLKKSKRINKIILCTTANKSDDLICNIVKKYNISFVRGPEKDVLSRMLLACDQKTNIVVRVTGDDILIDAKYLDKAIDHSLKNNAEYCSVKSIPQGTEVELYNLHLLYDLHKTLKNKDSTEYLTNIINDNYQNFNTLDLPVKKKHNKKIRLTLDTKQDYKVINFFLTEMNKKNKLLTYSMDDLLYFFKKNKNILNINKNIKQKKIPNSFSTDILWSKLIN